MNSTLDSRQPHPSDFGDRAQNGATQTPADTTDTAGEEKEKKPTQRMEELKKTYELIEKTCVELQAAEQAENEDLKKQQATAAQEVERLSQTITEAHQGLLADETYAELLQSNLESARQLLEIKKRRQEEMEEKMKETEQKVAALLASQKKTSLETTWDQIYDLKETLVGIQSETIRSLEETHLSKEKERQAKNRYIIGLHSTEMDRGPLLIAEEINNFVTQAEKIIGEISRSQLSAEIEALSKKLATTRGQKAETVNQITVYFEKQIAKIEEKAKHYRATVKEWQKKYREEFLKKELYTDEDKFNMEKFKTQQAKFKEALEKNKEVRSAEAEIKKIETEQAPFDAAIVRVRSMGEKSENLEDTRAALAAWREGEEIINDEITFGKG